MFNWVNLLFWVLKIIPAEAAVVQEGVATHFGKDHVEQATKVLGLVSDAVKAAGIGMERGTVDPNPSPQMGAAPPT